MNASWPQTKTIWSICIKVKADGCECQASDPAFWKKMSDDGRLDRSAASSIISAFISRDLTAFSQSVSNYDPGFYISTTKWDSARRWTPKKKQFVPVTSQRPAPDAEPAEVEEAEEVEAEATEEDAGSAKPEGEADEFERRLKQLEAAHKREKEKARKEAEALMKTKALEKFTPESIEYVKPAIFDDVCAMVKGGVQVCLVGPSGCGKSLLITEVAKVLKRDLYIESFAGGKRYSQVFGSTHLVDGKSEWTPAKFMQELQKDDNIVFMDEVMSADPDVLIGANPILDRKTRCFHSPIGVISVAKHCTICAASNVTGREYSMNYKGTQQQDASVLNRFVHVHMAYDEKVEETIVMKAPLDSVVRGYLLEQMKKLRQAIATHNIGYDPSTRKLVQAIELIALGLPKNKAFEYAFITPLSQLERVKIGM